MVKVRYIKNPYASTTHRVLLDQIRKCRPEAADHSLAEFWRVGNAICEMRSNGFYHVYTLVNDPFYGKIVRDNVLSKDGQLRETNRFYPVPKKEDYIKWLTERNISLEV